MKFVVSNMVLSKHLQMMGGVISGNSRSLPILEDFLFEISNDRLVVSASDHEMIMSCQVEIKSQDEGRAAVPARMLQEILKSLPDQPLTFSVDSEKAVIRIESESGEYSLVGHSPDEYPQAKEVLDPQEIVVPASVLAKGD